MMNDRTPIYTPAHRAESVLSQDAYRRKSIITTARDTLCALAISGGLVAIAAFTNIQTDDEMAIANARAAYALKAGRPEEAFRYIAEFQESGFYFNGVEGTRQEACRQLEKKYDGEIPPGFPCIGGE